MRTLVLLVLLLAGPASAQRGGPYRIAETGESHERLQQAVDAIGNGQGTIEIAPGTYRDCAVQNAGRIAYVARKAGTVTFNGGICEDKATLVLDGESAHVEGITFTNTAVDDGNGAGIRIEQGDLTVVGARFVDAESGILSANDPESTISIDRSTFSGLGKHPHPDGVHSIYVNGYGGLRITNSRFERGMSGHYVKSRAPRVEIVNCSFDDSRGRDTNYMIDLSNGAVGRIAGNSFVNGRNKDNFGTMITVAPEGRKNSSAGLVIENNKAWLVPGFPFRTALVGSWTDEPLVIRGNLLSGGITEFAPR